MIRISTIFIATCMLLIAGSVGLAVHMIVGLDMPQSGIVAFAALTLLIFYNVVSRRLRNRTDVSGQIAGLSRGTTDLARQVTEFGRRLVAIEHRLSALDATTQERDKTTLGEISELGTLVRQLAISIAVHDELLTTTPSAMPHQATPSPAAPATASASAVTPANIAPPAAVLQRNAAEPVPSPRNHAQPPNTAQASDNKQALPAVQKAIDTNAIDVYLQPLVTLPQRKVVFYEAVSRIRSDDGQLIAANDFIATAEAGGLMAQIDRMVLLRSVQILRRLMGRNKEVGLFCNISAATLGNEAVFAQCLDFLETNRALAPSLILEFKQSTLRGLSQIESEHLAALAQRGYRFSIDHVSDLRIEPRDLADRGVRFIKVPAHMLLDQEQMSMANIHPADLSDLLGRFGIDLIAERIEGERAVLDLLDYNIRFGQGFLFAAPRPLRSEGAPATAVNGDGEAPKPDKIAVEAAKIEPARMTGKAALARRRAELN